MNLNSSYVIPALSPFVYRHLRWAFSCAALSVEVYEPPSLLCPMHMLFIPFPLLIWRLWCSFANGLCLYLFSKGYWACYSCPTLPDGYYLSPAVLVSQRGYHGHGSQSPACDTSRKAGVHQWADVHQCVPTFPQVLSFGQWVREHHHQYPMPLSLIFRALKDLRSLCQHHWCPGGWTAKALQGPKEPQNALHSITYMGPRKAAKLTK